MTSIKECAAQAGIDFKLLSAEELMDYARDVVSKSRSYNDVKGVAAIEKAIKETDRETLAAFFNHAQTLVNNEFKQSYLAKKIEGGKETLRDLVGMRWRGKGDNIEVAQKAAQNRMIDKAFAGLNEEDVAYLMKKENQIEVGQAMDGYKASPQAEKVADTLRKYIIDSNADMVMADALPLRFSQNRRYLSAVHDRNAILKGGRQSFISSMKNPGKMSAVESKLKWTNDIKKMLDLEETFATTKAYKVEGAAGLLDEKEVDNILSTIYDNIISGRSEIFTRSAVLNDAQAIEKRSRMFFVWKDFNSFIKYNDKYGHGDLFSAIMRDAESKGRQIGRSELLGSNPDVAYTELKGVQQAVSPKKQGWYDRTDMFYKEVRGDSSAAVDPTLAAFGSNIRQYSSMARLLGLVASSLTDANIAATYASKWGQNYFRSFARQFEGVIATGSSEQRRELARMMHLNLKSHMGFMGKFSDIENAGDLTNKISTYYYRMIGMNRWDQGNRIASMQTLSDALGKNSGSSFDKLSPEMALQFDKHGIGAAEWDVLRKYTANTPEGRFFSLDNVEKITNEDLKKLYADRGGDVPLYQLRNELYRKVFSVFEAAQENAILTPNAWAKMLMTQGTKSGTWIGEAMRMFMQFKGFAISYMDRSLMEGFADADGAWAKVGFALQQFGAIMPLSYFSTYLYYMSSGLSMPDPSEMSFSENVSFFAGIAAPGFGIFSGILDSNNQNQNLITSFMLTPSIRLMSNMLSAPAALATGNPELAFKDTLKALQYGVPGGGHTLGNPLVKQMLGEHPYLLPGQEIVW